ncbi:MAG: hypothetical protein NVSMB1_00980 [Polyangiales bacterium]
MRKAVGFAVAASLFTAVCATPEPASAQAEVSGTGKGIVGGALLGGEVGLIGLSAFGAKQSWMYYVIPGAFAVGGGVGGYFIEKSASPQVSLGLLAGGMALIIPTVVITLSANAYHPGSEDNTPVDATPADAGRVGGSATVDSSATSTTGGSPSSPSAAAGASGTSTTIPPTPPKHKPAHTSSRRPSVPRALLNYTSFSSTDRLEVAIPAMQVSPSYTRVEMEKFGLSQRYEFHAPVVAVNF